jgi:Holliday junction DNA helicase RuvA
MISYIHGQIIEKSAPAIIVDVHGIGYQITLTTPDFDAYNLNDTVKIHTHHLVREQSEELFGFSTLSAKKLFELLISVQGVGPRAAIAILSLAPPADVRNSIASADTAFISSAPGIGKKTADRLILDLRDKIGLPTHYGRPSSAAPTTPTDEALEALIALGFTLSDATKSLSGIDPTLPVESRIKLALKK